jgi:hypothetical protein
MTREPGESDNSAADTSRGYRRRLVWRWLSLAVLYAVGLVALGVLIGDVIAR